MVKSFFKLIRWPNLVIILLSMVFLLWLIIRPGLGIVSENIGMNPFEFVLLTIAVLSIAVGGYIINDIKDRKVDRLNKPGENSVNMTFTEKQAFWMYWIFTIIGIACGTIVSFLFHKSDFSLIFILTAGLLWFYAKAYQCQPLTGNLVVAFLSALSFGLVFLYELFALQTHEANLHIDVQSLDLIYYIILIYMGFAFLTSLLREIIKDIEDVDGDEQVGCRTLAVVHGKQKAKTVAQVVNIVGLTAAFWFQWFFYQKGFFLVFSYFFLIDLLFGWILIKSFRAKEKQQFSRLSFLIKLLMFAGLLSMIVFYFEF